MIWVLAVVLIVVGALAYVVVMGDKPVFLRGKDLEFLKDLARSFSVDRGEGSTLVMGYDERPELIEVVKGPDTGEISQEVILRIATTELPKEDRLALATALSGQGMGILVEFWDDRASTAYLEITVRGTPDQIGLEVFKLAEAVVAALRIGSTQRFTFKVHGDIDMSVWRRENKDVLDRMASGGRFRRWLAKRLHEAD